LAAGAFHFAPITPIRLYPFSEEDHMKRAFGVLLIGLLVLAIAQNGIGEDQRTIEVETFKYLQHEEGKVKANQVENRRVRRIYLERSVAEVITEAIIDALSSMGFTVTGSADRTIQGTIKNLLVDDAFEFIHYYLEIQFDVLAAEKSVYSKAFKAYRRRLRAPFTDKMARQMVNDCVKRFVKDARKKGAL
jgi:hypothetical protein